MAAASSISIARISLRLSERRVAEHGHDLVCRAAVVGHSTTESFPQAVGLAIDRQSSGSDRMPHELRKASRSERPSEGSVDDGNVISRGMVESATQVGMKMGFDINASLAPRVIDAGRGLVDLAPSHPVNISTRGTNVQHQAVGGALLRAKRPVALKGRCLGIGPGANCPAFRAL
jgi:hypothetical protein